MVYIMKNRKFKDKSGETIWFPNDERPYYDRALGKKFNTIKEKKEYMDKNSLIMDGSSDKHRDAPEAGDRGKKKVYFT